MWQIPSKMKKVLIFLIVNLLTINIFSQEWVDCGSSNPIAPSIKLISSSEQETTVSFALQGFFHETVSTPRGSQSLITVPKMVSLLEEAAPDLPLLAIPILIGVGVDNGIHMVHRYFEDGRELRPMVVNTGRALAITALTSIVGFGSLCLSKFQGLDSIAQLGLLSTLALVLVLASSLIAFPSLIAAIAPKGGGD